MARFYSHKDGCAGQTDETLDCVGREKEGESPGRVLPYMGYIGTCRKIGYGF